MEHAEQLAHASLCNCIVLVDRPSILLELLHEILNLSGFAQPAPGARDAIERIAAREPCLLEPWVFYRVRDRVFTSDAGRTVGRWDAAL